jgi:hypothetical protein
MKRPNGPPTPLPDWAAKLVEDTTLRIQNTIAARKLWNEIFNANDRRRCGNDLEVAYANGKVIGMWKAARGGTPDEAFLNAAHALGFLTDQARESLAQFVPGTRRKPDPARPCWNSETRQLTYRGKVVREVKRPKQAYNIVTILQAFEAAGWPPRIDDPHGRKPSDENRRRDVENLNKLILVPIIRFECDGNGTGFLWKSLPQPRATKATKAVKATKATKRRKK